MKAIKQPEFKVWCEQCYIRIAPNEERVTNRSKTYHIGCYSKLIANGSIEKKAKDAAKEAV